ncbi:hypothetical protein OFM13_29515, partial [Escherichia coli]|nr:hypothetical protein [Escherichia coli]
TVVVALASSLLTLLLGTMAAYGLTRFVYRPRIGLILSFVGCILFAVMLAVLKVPWQLALVIALALYILVAQTLGRRFRRALGNSDIAFWMIS